MRAQLIPFGNPNSLLNGSEKPDDDQDRPDDSNREAMRTNPSESGTIDSLNCARGVRSENIDKSNNEEPKEQVRFCFH